MNKLKIWNKYQICFLEKLEKYNSIVITLVWSNNKYIFLFILSWNYSSKHATNVSKNGISSKDVITIFCMASGKNGCWFDDVDVAFKNLDPSKILSIGCPVTW